MVVLKESLLKRLWRTKVLSLSLDEPRKGKAEEI
jgi:hypothetical protein